MYSKYIKKNVSEFEHIITLTFLAAQTRAFIMSLCVCLSNHSLISCMRATETLSWVFFKKEAISVYLCCSWATLCFMSQTAYVIVLYGSHMPGGICCVSFLPEQVSQVPV